MYVTLSQWEYDDNRRRINQSSIHVFIALLNGTAGARSGCHVRGAMPFGISRRYICLAADYRRGVRDSLRAVYKVISIHIRRPSSSPPHRIDLISLISVNDFARGKRPSRYRECRTATDRSLFTYKYEQLNCFSTMQFPSNLPSATFRPFARRQSYGWAGTIGCALRELVEILSYLKINQLCVNIRNKKKDEKKEKEILLQYIIFVEYEMCARNFLNWKVYFCRCRTRGRLNNASSN